ncbi:adenylate/guanylate cyclase domain-containing protein [Roseiarcus sp.]|uniref:adenylate/guanylate cyclase domain-containing protein n=1 Tax=Roseiarcus sp. TaxID=1969460 RepID=UPI003F97F6C4
MDRPNDEIAQSGRLSPARDPHRRPVLPRSVGMRRGFPIVAIVGGFIGGLAYRLAFDPEAERTLLEFLRSGMHGVCLGLTIWAVQTAFDAGNWPGVALRKLPLAVEVVVKALALTGALIAVGLVLQFILYADVGRGWVTSDLVRIVAVSFAFSMVVGVVIELERLIGAPLLMSALLGVYHRPTRRRLIVMFLDMANSTRLAEAMGEVKVHDLITRFFFDIDEPIADFGGAVHAYVGDEVIVSWPLSDDPTRNGRCVACFDAIGRKIDALASSYEREFGVVPAFRAGIHAGTVVVSECGDAKRQLAFFGDTMNVAARLCDYCKSIDASLVISGDLRRALTAPDGVLTGERELVEARGRRERVEAHVVRFARTPSRSVRHPS